MTAAPLKVTVGSRQEDSRGRIADFLSNTKLDPFSLECEQDSTKLDLLSFECELEALDLLNCVTKFYVSRIPPVIGVPNTVIGFLNVQYWGLMTYFCVAKVEL
ncbi:hypothetical protein F0562_014344 [Nyssa sinensis]|uniref:Uncharacterized protein n=1 Tax=Nyssa sinensis TaxID=561372 RepID=A0A5J4ZQV4_9ASTE|nr:hypothetical protein F0562_014344 [Nyssa sinensis]